MKKLWNLYSDLLGTTPLHPQFLMLRLTQKGIKEAEKRAHGKLIDLGCGRMPYRKLFEPIVESYTALDHPKTSKLYSPKLKPDIFADVLDMPVKNSSFDTALFLEVIEYLDNPGAAIKEIGRILKKDGYLILTSPFLYPIHDYPNDKIRLTEPAIRDILKANKFKIVKLEALGTFWDFWFLSLNIYLFKNIQEQTPPKNIFRFIFLLIYMFVTTLVFVSGNIIALILDWFPKTGSKKPNLFPLNYLVVGRKI